VSERSERNPGIKPHKRSRAREAGDRDSLFPSPASQAQLNSRVRFSRLGCASPGATLCWMLRGVIWVRPKSI